MITALGLIARALLAAVFAVAGTAKLRNYDGTRRTLQSFGTPAKIAGPSAVLLPIAALKPLILSRKCAFYFR